MLTTAIIGYLLAAFLVFIVLWWLEGLSYHTGGMENESRPSLFEVMRLAMLWPFVVAYLLLVVLLAIARE